MCIDHPKNIRSWQCKLARRASSPKAWLLVQSNERFGQEVALDAHATLIIGRDAEHAGIVLDDPKVSRCHASLEWQDGAYVIRDLNSLYGTYVNNRLVHVQALRHNDLIVLGDTRLIFIGQVF